MGANSPSSIGSFGISVGRWVARAAMGRPEVPALPIPFRPWAPGLEVDGLKRFEALAEPGRKVLLGIEPDVLRARKSVDDDGAQLSALAGYNVRKKVPGFVPADAQDACSPEYPRRSFTFNSTRVTVQGGSSLARDPMRRAKSRPLQPISLRRIPAGLAPGRPNAQCDERRPSVGYCSRGNGSHGRVPPVPDAVRARRCGSSCRRRAGSRRHPRSRCWHSHRRRVAASIRVRRDRPTIPRKRPRGGARRRSRRR